jgi:hypothetical protein
MKTNNVPFQNYDFAGKEQANDDRTDSNDDFRGALRQIFYALLNYLSKRFGWGRNESINILFFYPTVTFTTGVALAQIFDIRASITLFFLVHLFLGLAFFVFGAYYVNQKKEQKLDVSRTLESIAWWFFWLVLCFFYSLISIFTGVTLILVLTAGSGIYSRAEMAISIISFIIVVYFWIIHFVYRRFEAEKSEGVLAVVEMIMWTVLIVATGGGESSFLYLYFITLMPALRRGFPKDLDLISPDDYTPESLRPSIWEWFKKNWSGNIFLSLGFLICIAIIMSLISWVIPVEIEQSAASSGGFFQSPVQSLVHTYLHTGGWLLLVSIMAIYLELDLDAFRLSIDLMEDEIKKEWADNSGKIVYLVKSLEKNIQSECYFRATGLLVATITVPKANFENIQFKAKGYQIKDIEREKRKEPEPVDLVINADFTPDSESLGLNKLLGRILLNEDSSINTQSIYYADNESNREIMDNLRGIIADGGDRNFFDDARSVGIIIFSTAIKDAGNISITLAIFKSKWRGEFDRNSIKLYEALSVQVVGIYKKYELYQERETAAVESGFIADLAMTLTHDFNKQASLLATSLGTLSTEGKDWWMSVSPAEISDSKKFQGIWNAQFSAYLLRSRLMLVDRVARHSSVMSGESGLYYTLATKSAKEGLPIAKALAIGCWIAYNGDNTIKVKSPDAIAAKSWRELNYDTIEEGADNWITIIDSFFENVSNDTYRAINNASFALPAINESESDDVLVDLWKLIFNELARNGKTARKPSQLSVYKKAEQLVLTWKSSFSGGKEQVKKNWGTKKDPLPKKGDPARPGKPTKPGSGWGQYGNYVVVDQMLQQPYEIFWKLGDEPNTYEWTTQISLSSPVINWRVK